jgi:2'-5' RNA ligase
MKSIVTAIDDPWRDQIAGIWGELKAVFGLDALTGAARPCLTFHVAEDYVRAGPGAGIEDALARVAARGTPFRIQTHGLGLTEGAQAVIYLHVTRTETLDDVHHVVHHAAQPHAINPRAAHQSETWLPHIAVAAGPIPPADIPRVLEFLARRDYAWTITASNLCLIPDTRLVAAGWLRFDLKGKAART